MKCFHVVYLSHDFQILGQGYILARDEKDARESVREAAQQQLHPQDFARFGNYEIRLSGV